MTGVMRAAVGGKGESLRVAELPMPEPEKAEILVEVSAAGLNRADLAQRAGSYPPPPGASPVLGLEVSGTVVACGPEAARFRVGDRVCALLSGGGYATHVTVDEGSVLPVPGSVDLVTAAAFPEAMMTVWANVFDRARLQPGETFLCHGATSGIGVMALQMARIAGASRIFATAGNEDKCRLARELGADLAINYREQDFEALVRAEGGADVTLDMVGGDYVQKNIGAARVDGRIINIAYQQGFSTHVNFAPVLMKRLSLMATTLRARSLPEKRRIRNAIEQDFWPHVATGRIRVVVDSVFPLSEAEAALARLQSGAHSGKILLKV